MYYVTEDIGEVYVCYWNWEPDLFSYNGYIVFEPLHPSPSPFPSASPSPAPTTDPTPNPTPKPSPSASASPSAPPPPTPEPTPTPEPPRMKLKAESILSPNGDRKFDTVDVEVYDSNVTWELYVDTPEHLIAKGQGNAEGDDAISWNGAGKRADGTLGTLEHGEYLLRLHATNAALEDLYAEVNVDLKGPEATEIKFEQGKVDREALTVLFKQGRYENERVRSAEISGAAVVREV